MRQRTVAAALSARTSPQPPPSSATSLKAGATNDICSIIMGHKVASFLLFFPHFTIFFCS